MILRQGMRHEKRLKSSPLICAYMRLYAFVSGSAESVM